MSGGDDREASSDVALFASEDADEINPQRSPDRWTRPASASTAFPMPALPDARAAFTPDAPPAVPGAQVAHLPLPGAWLGTKPLPFRGINLSSAEFGAALPGIFGKDYTFSKPAEIDYYLSKGFNTFRIGFKWERMQPVAHGELDATYFRRLEELVTYATSRGASVILNPHNFARYYGTPVGSSKVPSAVFADFWGRMATAYASNGNVMFNLVNEPHDMPTEQWVDAANDAIAAIRLAGATNIIVVPGNAWTGAHAWSSGYYGTPNAVAMLEIVDPLNRVFFEVHQYLDADSSGGSGTCISKTIGSERLANFVAWLRQTGRKGFLGEFAGGNNPTCRDAVEDMLQFMNESADVMAGWAWWAGGPWWGDYKFTLHPDKNGDRPQLSFLTSWLKP